MFKKILCVLVVSGCASSRLVDVNGNSLSGDVMPKRAQAQAKADNVAKGAGNGALTGAKVCGAPALVGLHAGPIGFVIGGALSIVCLPFGVTLGALAGGLNAASANRDHDATARGTGI